MDREPQYAGLSGPHCQRSHSDRRSDGGARYPIAEASNAYAALQADPKPLNVILTYQDAAEPIRQLANPAVRVGRAGAVRLALIGAGGFAKSTLLPILRDEPERFTLACVCARQGHTAMDAARRHGAGYGTTDFAAVLADGDIDAVMIATRHNKHAEMALAALARRQTCFCREAAFV